MSDRQWKWQDTSDLCEFFTMPSDTTADTVLDSDRLMRVAPEIYKPRFDAIAEERKRDDGTLYKGQAFRKVASFINLPALKVAEIRNPALLKDKREFYRWIDRGENYRYCTYDRRKNVRPNQWTYNEGKPII